MIERKDHESQDLIAIRGTKLGRTQLTGTMSQELGSLFSVTWWEAFQWNLKMKATTAILTITLRSTSLQGLGASDCKVCFS